MTPNPTGFHEGEIAVQERAGVRDDAARLTPMLSAPDLNGGAHRFLAERDLIVLTARDREGLLWSTALAGAPGFLDARDTTLVVQATPSGNDPLSELPADQPVGMLAIDFSRRRRIRINGILTAATRDRLEVSVDQAYGNCPQYIHPRRPDPAVLRAAANVGPAARASTLNASQIREIEQSDTFFLGTIHPGRGADASHRGGPAGFVRVSGNQVVWPDFPGNNMFNSFGNLAVDDAAALLFIDFTTGRQLHLSGTAAVEWLENPTEEATGRQVRFTVRQISGG
jgi:predicted pyridoxine 5'-phosphate oxidase superfamily flavin-nucleotide-binding protein